MMTLIFIIFAATGLLASLIVIWLALSMLEDKPIEQIDADEEVLGEQVDIRRFYQRWEDRL
jgi:hypothetical protein